MFDERLRGALCSEGRAVTARVVVGVRPAGISRSVSSSRLMRVPRLVGGSMGKMSGLMENWPFEGPGPSMVSSRFSLGTFQELFARVRRYLGVTTPSEIASREGLGVMSADVEVESGIAGKNSADWRAGGINDMTWKPVPWVRVVVVVMAVGCVEFCFRGGREGVY